MSERVIRWPMRQSINSVSPLKRRPMAEALYEDKSENTETERFKQQVVQKTLIGIGCFVSLAIFAWALSLT